MSVEIEGLEFQVEAKSDKGADGIDKLANSFKNLKSAIKGGTNLNGSIKQLEKLNQALSGLHTDKLESLGKAMESLNKAGNIKIPASVPKRISEIGNAMKSISQSDIDRMESMSRALQGMQGLQNVRVPQVNTGGTGSGTPNPADINTEPASSGRSTSHSGTQTEDVSNTGGADNGMSHADSQLQEVTRSAGMARTTLSGVKKVIGEIGGLTGISYVGQQIGSLPHKIGQALGSLRTMYSEFKKSGGILGAFGRTIKAVATNLGSKLAAGMKQVTSSLGNAFTYRIKEDKTMSNQFGFLSDDTFAEKMDTMNQFLAAIATGQGGSLKPTSWSDVQALVRKGLASKVFAVGDQLTCQRGSTTLVWDIIGFDIDTPADKQFTHSMTLQLHEVFDFVQFNAPAAMYYAEEELAAGIYHVTPKNGSLFGGWDAALVTLVIFMAIDYVTGLLVAGVFHNSGKTENGALESRAGWKGLCRKCITLLMVLVATRLDLVTGTNFIRDAVVIAFIANETISIVENAGLMGINIPPAITSAIEVLKKKSDSVDNTDQ